MPSYVYQARDHSGASASGVLHAPTIEDAGRMLRNDGKIVVDLHEQIVTRTGAKVRRRRVRAEDILYFSNQLAVMVDTGIPLTEALDCIAAQAGSPSLKAVVSDMADQVKGGVEFSAALGRYPRVFDTVYVNMVRASEVSGTMGQMLERLAEFQRDQQETRKKVRGALVYPACMLVFCVTVVTVMMVGVLPRFEKIYEGKGAVLPGPTRMLLGTSHFLFDYWPFIIAALVGSMMALLTYMRTEQGGLAVDRMRLRVPVFGKMYNKLFISRSLRTLSTMLASGVELLECVEITAAVVGNRVYRNMWLRVRSRLKEGNSLSDEVHSAALMPRSVAQMIASGDKSGRLSDVMRRIAEFCDSDLKVGIKTMTSMIEPAMIIIMGLLVGGIAMALLLPVFSISKVVAH